MKKLIIQRFLLAITAIILVSGVAWTPAGAMTRFAATRIHFAPGATSGIVNDELDAYSSASYVLRAAAGQLMDVTLSAPAGVSLKATTSGGQAMTPIAGTSGSTGFRGYLPYTGDYYLTVTVGSQAVDFSMDVFIPVRVSFDLGATSTRLVGHLNAHQGLDYILRAGEGQIMEVNAVPETADVPLQLIIYGVDGTLLRSGMGEGSSFRGTLPSSQDYIVTVKAGEQAADFAMDVIIPQRIRFEPGAFSGRVRTYLPASHTQYYVLRAMEDQRMQVEITPDDDLQLIIYGVDGTVLRSGMGEGASFDGLLPSTQDYILAVRNAGEAASYTLRVTIY
jgi:hypothetical protein